MTHMILLYNSIYGLYVHKNLYASYWYFNASLLFACQKVANDLYFVLVPVGIKFWASVQLMVINIP